MAKVGARATNQSLQRSSEVRRYPLLLAFLKQSLYNFSDALIEMVNQRLGELYREAKRTFEIDRLKATKSIDAKLKTLQNLGQVLLDDSIEDQTVRATVFESIEPEERRLEIGWLEMSLRVSFLEQHCLWEHHAFRQRGHGRQQGKQD